VRRLVSSPSPAIRTLFILRHANAEHTDGVRDEDRQLTKRGRRAAERTGELLSDRLPDRILSSSSARTRETVERFSKSAHYHGPVEYLDALYLAEPAAYLAAVKTHGGNAERLLLVGHNPGLEALVTRLTGERVSLPTAALVECTLDVRTWSDVTEQTSAELTGISYPREE
jgi:phosphohistidine phosphatase